MNLIFLSFGLGIIFIAIVFFFDWLEHLYPIKEYLYNVLTGTIIWAICIIGIILGIKIDLWLFGILAGL